MMLAHTKTLFASLLVTLFLTGNVRAENWPQFRGPSGRGMSNETDIPLNWSSTQNIAWKTDIPGEGWSSPVVWDDRVFLTTATEEGVSCRAICIDRRPGRILWNTEVVRQTPRKKRRENSYASPTPVIDGEQVYVVFGDGSVAALDMDGRVLWTNREVKFYSHHGLGASPILDSDLLIMPFDGSSDGDNNRVGWKIPWDKGVLMAYDSQTGQVAWRGRRGLSRLSHVTPVVLGTGNSRRILSNAGDVVRGGAAAHATDRVNYVGRRAGGGNHWERARKRDVKRRITPVQGDRWRDHGAVFFDYGRRDAHHFGFVVDPRAMRRKPLARLFVAHQQPGLFQNFQRGVVHVTNFVGLQERKILHFTCVQCPAFSANYRAQQPLPEPITYATCHKWNLCKVTR